MEEQRREGGLLGARGVGVDPAAGRQTQQEGSQALADRRRRRIVQRAARPGGGELQARRNVAIVVRALALEPELAPEAHAVVAGHAGHRAAGGVIGGGEAGRPRRSQRGVSAAVHHGLREGEARRVVLGADLVQQALREAEREQVEAAALPPRGVVLIAQPVTHVKQQLGLEDVDIVQRQPVAGVIGHIADGRAANVLVLLVELAVAEPEEGAVLLAEVLIQAPDHRAVVPVLLLDVEEVVAPVGGARLVRLRPVRDDLEGHRVDAAGRDEVARQRLPAEPAGPRGRPRGRGGGRIVDLVTRAQLQQFREVARPLFLGRHGALHRPLPPHVHALVAEAPEGAVAAVVQARQHHRPGERVSPPLVEPAGVGLPALLRRHRPGGGIPQPPVRKPRHRPHSRVEVVAGSPEPIGAGARAHVDHCASRMAEGGVVGDRLDPELLHEVRRRRAVGGVPPERVGRAVQRHLARSRPRAVDYDLARGEIHGGIARAVPRRHHDARRKPREVKRVAAGDRQLGGSPLVHNHADRGGRRFQQRALRGHHHRLGHVADLQREVQRHAVIDPQLDVLPHRPLETRQLGRHPIHAR